MPHEQRASSPDFVGARTSRTGRMTMRNRAGRQTRRRAAWRGLAASLALWLAPMPAAAEGAVPAALLERAAREGPVRVIVRLDELVAPVLPPGAIRARQRARIARAQERVRQTLAGSGYRRLQRYRSIPYLALEADLATLERLDRSDRVLHVIEDVPSAPHLDGSVPRVGADDAWDLGFDGTGQTIVVLDTGIDASHPNFAGQIVAEACFASGQPGDGDPGGDCPDDLTEKIGPDAAVYCGYDDACFHGTHVAGIAGGTGPSYPGVARGAGLIPIQVFSEYEGGACGSSPSDSPCPLANRSDQLAALEHVLDELRFQHAIAAVNMSLGSGLYSSHALCDLVNQPITLVVAALRAQGIPVVSSAGNGGHDDGISWPACVSGVVSVGAVNDSDTIASFSNSVAFLSLWAPGVKIRAPTAPFFGSSQYVNADGTSMAAPHVAGAFALLRQAAPTATIDDVLAALELTGAPVTGSTDAATTRIQIDAALAWLTPPACSDGLDNDGDGAADMADPGCETEGDGSEQSALLVCDDGIDNDGDGVADSADPGCGGPDGLLEDPQCQDGLDNEITPDGRVDFDGGASAGLAPPPGGVYLPDPECQTASRNSEGNVGCAVGVGPLLALGAGLLRLPARRRGRPGRATGGPNA